MQLTTAEVPAAVLSWLIRFPIMDQVAAANGISVTEAQSQAGLASLSSVAQQAASQNGLSSTVGAAHRRRLAADVPAARQLGGAGDGLRLKVNGGKEPTTTAEQNTVTAAITKAQCTAAKSLNIQVSPQFGRLDYTEFTVVPAADTLSRPAGTPTAASTEGLTPAC